MVEFINKVATSEFVKNFHERLVEYGNELIAERISEAFGE